MWCCTAPPVNSSRVAICLVVYAKSRPKGQSDRPSDLPQPDGTPLHTRGTLSRSTGIVSHPPFRLCAAATKYHPTHASTGVYQMELRILSF